MRSSPTDEFRVAGKEYRDAMKLMTHTFFAAVQQHTGTYRYRGFLWHAFTFGFQIALEGKQATEVFDASDVCELYRFDEETDRLWKCPKLIATSGIYDCLDSYLFPVDYSWLYITTHEHSHGIGPFFFGSDRA